MFHTRIDTIMAGCVLALLPAWPRAWAALKSAIRPLWAGPGALVALYVTLWFCSTGSRLVASLALTAQALVLAYCLAFVVQNANTLPGRVLNWRPLMHLGLISYSVYLWQQLFTGPARLLPKLWLALPATLVLAELSYHFVEKPSYWLRDRFFKPLPAAISR